MTIAQDDGDAQVSEEDYWASIRAYNADGSYAYPPPPINADQLLDFWMRVPVPDDVLAAVQWRDNARHAEMEAVLNKYYSTPRRGRVKGLLFSHGCPSSFWLEGIQEELAEMATMRKYRKHPERLEQSRTMADFRRSTERTEEIRATVPPQRIPREQLRMAARLGKLMHAIAGLQPAERSAAWRSEVVFMGERQTVHDAYNTWEPDRIVV